MRAAIGTILLLTCFCVISSNAQVCLPSFAGKDTIIPCNINCFNLQSKVPDLRGTTDYKVVAIPYTPFDYVSKAPALTLPCSINDDKFYDVYDLPFDFCFYGQVYQQITASTNGVVSFDVSNALKCNGWNLLNSPNTPEPLPSGGTGSCVGIGPCSNPTDAAFYPRAAIFGVYYDLDIDQFSPNKKTELRVEGVAPCRRLILSFFEVPLYECNSMLATHQIVFYESTGIIDVYVKDRPACKTWNEGRGIIGIQNWNRDQAVYPPGRNGDIWSGSNEAWRFIPNSGNSLFKSVQLFRGTTLVATGDTSSNSLGELNVQFPGVCSNDADSVVYQIVANYESCSNPSSIITITDTLIVRREIPFTVSTTIQNATCTTNNLGGITIMTPLGAAYEYSLDSINWQSSQQFNGVVPGTATVYTRIKASPFCVSKQSVQIPLEPAVSFLPTATKTKCYGSADGLIVFKPGIGKRPFRFSIDNGINYQVDSSFLVRAGTYSLRMMDAAGCTKDSVITILQPDSISVQVNVKGAYCSGNKDGLIQVLATGGNSIYTYALDQSVFQTQAQLPATVGAYTVHVKDQNNCMKDTFQVIVPLIDTMKLQRMTNAAVCEGSSIQLNPQTNADAFSWTPVNSLDHPTIKNPTASPTDTIKYYLTAKLGLLCERKDSIIIAVQHPPLVNAGKDSTICYGTPATLLASTIRGTNFLWTPANTLSNFSQAATTAFPKQTTTYTVAVNDIYGCGFTQTDQVTITVKAPVLTNAGIDTTAVVGLPVQLNGCCGVQYLWEPFYLFNDSKRKDPIGIFNADTKVSLTTFRDDGCPGWDTIQIKAYKGPDIYVPTAFSPNNDGLNDQFIPVPVGISKMNYFRVYNRWGQMIYSGTTFMQGWDGRYKGIDQDNGHYTWMVSGISIDGKIITKKGIVMLVR